MKGKQRKREKEIVNGKEDEKETTEILKQKYSKERKKKKLYY